MNRPTPCRVALFGECMVELSGPAFGTLLQAFGGDTLNTAIYLARCTRGQAVSVHHATALGDDGLSNAMMAFWAAEGVQLDLVRRLPGRLPGLYMIEVDADGERHFHYWRNDAAARAYFETDAATGPTPLEATPLPFDWLYVSGISLAILPPAGRARLLALMDRLRAGGGSVVFDNNYRPRLWSDAATAQSAYAAVLARTDVALMTLDDHQLLHGLSDQESALASLAALPVPELVIRRGALPTMVRAMGRAWQHIPTEVVKVVDTTAAGDSFAGGYLARRLSGHTADDAAVFGNRLAARVIQHPGAIVPLEALRDLLATDSP